MFSDCAHYQQLSLNMAYQIVNELAYIKHCWLVYGKNRIYNWTAELTIIASNVASVN